MLAPILATIQTIRVAQFPSEVGVAPHDPIAPERYCASVQVCAMYSDAIHTEVPSVTAAP